MGQEKYKTYSCMNKKIMTLDEKLLHLSSKLSIFCSSVTRNVTLWMSPVWHSYYWDDHGKIIDLKLGQEE